MASIYIEYLDGTTEERKFGSFIQALNEQGKLLQNKKFKEQTKIIQVRAFERS